MSDKSGDSDLVKAQPVTEEPEIETLSLPSGVSMKVPKRGITQYDWASIKVLTEGGVDTKEICRQFKGLTPESIGNKARSEGWLTPAYQKRMAKEVAKKQRAALAATGQVRDLDEVVQSIWMDRGARVNEKAFQLAEQALNAAIDEDVAENMISNASDLKTVTDVARKVTGQEAREQEDLGPKLAVNIGLLRSQI